MSAYEDLAAWMRFVPSEGPLRGDGERSRFSGSWSDTVYLLERETRMLGAENAMMEVDMERRMFRVDGLPRANATARSPGIILSFTATAVANKPNLRYEMTTFDNWHDNVRALALGLEALRKVARYGMGLRGEQYAGWRQLTTGYEVVYEGDSVWDAAQPVADTGPTRARGEEILSAFNGSRAAALRATHPDTRNGDGYDDTDFASVRLALGEG